MPWHEVRVALHVHSRYSDGSGTVDDIVRAAEGLVDVVWLTDHDGLGARIRPGEGRYGSVLLLVGAEMTPPTDHLLVLGTDFVPERNGPWEEAVRQVRDAGGVSFVAHPEDPGNPVLNLPSYRWTHRGIRGFTGLEVWNHLSQWMRPIKGVGSGLFALARPLQGAEGPDPKAVQLWDELAQEQRTVGVAGLDAHAVRVPLRWLGFPVFSYRALFGWVSNHLFIEKPLDALPLETASLALLTAFREGRVALVNESAGRELGFQLWGRVGETVVPMGAEVPWAPGARIHVESPVAGVVSVVAAGEILGRHEVHPGEPVQADVPRAVPVRVEVARRVGPRLVPWTYSNPVYFRDSLRVPRQSV